MTGHWQLGLAVNIVTTAGLWLLAAAFIPRIRRDAAPVLRCIPLLKRLY